MNPQHACLALCVATLAAATWAAEPFGGAGLRTQSGANEARMDWVAGRSVGPLRALESQMSTGGFDRFRLVSADDKPSLSPPRGGPALGEASPSVRERELTQLRRRVEAQSPLPAVTLGPPGRR